MATAQELFAQSQQKALNKGPKKIVRQNHEERPWKQMLYDAKTEAISTPKEVLPLSIPESPSEEVISLKKSSDLDVKVIPEILLAPKEPPTPPSPTVKEEISLTTDAIIPQEEVKVAPISTPIIEEKITHVFEAKIEKEQVPLTSKKPALTGHDYCQLMDEINSNQRRIFGVISKLTRNGTEKEVKITRDRFKLENSKINISFLSPDLKVLEDNGMIEISTKKDNHKREIKLYTQKVQ